MLRELIGWLFDRGFHAAGTCLADDLQALCVHLRYPLRRRRRWRSTNLLERSLGEVKRRTKVIGRLPGESSCLSLCWAVLDLIITHADSITFTDLHQLQLQRIAREREPSNYQGGDRSLTLEALLSLRRGEVTPVVARDLPDAA